MNKIFLKLLRCAFIVIFALGFLPARALQQEENGDFVTIFPAAAGATFITTGPDGNLWFGEYYGIGRITPEGNVTYFNFCSDECQVFDGVSGPDGAIWFTEYMDNKVGRITLDGIVTEFSIPTESSYPMGIAAGPDGNLWFTEYAYVSTPVSKIGRITPEGVITEFVLPGSNTPTWGITAGPDGNLWFTEPGNKIIGQITSQGTVTEFSTPNISPQSITLGPDGNLWFTDWGEKAIGRMTLQGETTLFPIPVTVYWSFDQQETSSPSWKIITGPDGNLWFTEYGLEQIARITPEGEITEYVLPSPFLPVGITSGPDGNLWFASPFGGFIGRMSTAGSGHAVPKLGAITGFEDPILVNTDVDFTVPIVDPDADESHIAIWDWGDGTTSQGDVNVTNGSSYISGVHTYTGIGSYTVRLYMIYNNEFSYARRATINLRIVSAPVNRAPTVSPIHLPGNPVKVNTAMNVSAAFMDPDVGDSHTAVLDWGDGTTTQGIVSETNGSGDVVGSHTYMAIGDYTVNLTVSDNSGGSTQSSVQITVVNTSSGNNVSVSPGSDTSIEFANVSTPGNTLVSSSSGGPTPPTGFSLGDTPTYYEISTTATYDGPITVCIAYDPTQYSNPDDLHLLHYGGSIWEDVTVSTDTINHIICGQVTSLSPFLVAQRLYDFSGFFQPVDNLPMVNVVNAGRTVPVKFSLKGDKGLNILATGYPVSRQVACATGAPLDDIEETVTGGSGLSYDPVTSQYIYRWQTNKAWAGTCRQFILRLIDGTDHIANFKFK
jgi:streptogramin lyase